LKESTQLRFLKANNPDQLTKLVGALPFKVEIKGIMPDAKGFICFFTLHDSSEKVTNEMIKNLAALNG